MRRVNDNEAITITKPALPRLPVLLLARKDTGNGWVATSQPERFHGHKVTVLKRLPVRLVPASALDQFVRKTRGASFEANFGAVPKEFTDQLLSMLGIAGAAQKNDLAKVAMLAHRISLAKGTLVASWDRLSAVVSPWDKVAATLNTGLFGAMVVLWQKEAQQLVPALLCRTPVQALFAHALFRVSGMHGLGVCHRCGNPFFATRSKQFFCNHRCRMAEAMKRYRSRRAKQ